MRKPVPILALPALAASVPALVPVLALADGATLRVPLALDGFRGDATKVPVEMRLYESATGRLASYATVYPDASGAVEAGAAPGMYNVTIKSSHWLRRTLTSVAVSGTTVLPAVPLVNGDVNGDNYVTAGDRARVTAALGTQAGDPGYNANADLNGDGYVTAADRAISTARLSAQGDDLPIVATGLADGGWPAVGGGYGKAFAGRGPSVSAPGAPTLVGQTLSVVAVGPDGTLYTATTAQVAAQGGVDWTVSNDTGAYPLSLALTQGGVLLAGTDKGTVAHDAVTGALLWSSPVGTGSLTVGPDGTVYTGSRAGLSALDGATGAVRWTAAGFNVQAIGDDGTLYGTASVSSGGGANPRTTYYVRAYDPSSGAQRWSTSVGSSSGSSSVFYLSGLSVVGNAVYLKTSTSVKATSGNAYRSYCYARALKASSGAALWSTTIGTYEGGDVPGVGSPVAVRGGGAFTQWNGHAMALDAESGAKRWDVAGGAESVATSPDGTVYCAMSAASYTQYLGGLCALDPATGAARWRVAFPTYTRFSDLALADDGTIYVATISGKVYAVR